MSCEHFIQTLVPLHFAPWLLSPRADWPMYIATFHVPDLLCYLNTELTGTLSGYSQDTTVTLASNSVLQLPAQTTRDAGNGRWVTCWQVC